MHEYPHENGDVIVLGPQVFVSRDEAVLNWKGRNYVSQAERDRLWALAKARYGIMLGLRAERDRLRAVVAAVQAASGSIAAWVDAYDTLRLQLGEEATDG
jgi:hypothetical protein